MRRDHGKILANRAMLGTVADNECDNCGTPLIFALQAGDAQFSLDLNTILECLSIAEKEGCIPAIDTEWWNTVRNHYRLR